MFNRIPITFAALILAAAGLAFLTFENQTFDSPWAADTGRAVRGVDELTTVEGGVNPDRTGRARLESNSGSTLEETGRKSTVGVDKAGRDDSAFVDLGSVPLDSSGEAQDASDVSDSEQERDFTANPDSRKFTDEELARTAERHLLQVFSVEEFGLEGQPLSDRESRSITTRPIDSFVRPDHLLARFEVEVFGYRTLLTVRVDRQTGEVRKRSSFSPATTQQARFDPDEARALGAEHGLGSDLDLALILDSTTRRLAWQVRRKLAPGPGNVGQSAGVVLDLETGGLIANEVYQMAMTTDGAPFEIVTLHVQKNLGGGSK